MCGLVVFYSWSRAPAIRRQRETQEAAQVVSACHVSPAGGSSKEGYLATWELSIKTVECSGTSKMLGLLRGTARLFALSSTSLKLLAPLAVGD
jgi:hypothetical protein